MRTIIRVAAVLAGAAMVWGVGCGGDSNTGNGGAGGSGGQGTGGMTTSSSHASGTGGSGGAGGCTELTNDDFMRFQFGAIAAKLSPNLGKKDDDFLSVEFYTDDTGTFDLSKAPNDNYKTCNECVLVYEDAQAMTPGRTFFQTSGSLKLDASSVPSRGGTTGSVSDVTMVEVTIDPMTFKSTPVQGGACVHVASATFDIAGVPTEWTCDPTFYGAMDGCDCRCGAVDPDCMDTTQPVFGCGFDPTTSVCDATGDCTPPAGWTCTQAQYADGAACNCNCGVIDPDCQEVFPTTDCTSPEICGGTTGTCVAATPNGGETCGTATAIATSGLIYGTLNGAVADLDPTMTGCTMFDEPGGDVVYSVTLAVGQTLTATVLQQADDASLYLITDCADLTTCVAGADAGLAGQPDTLTFTATTAGTYFLVVDSFSTSNMSDFSLNVTLSP